MSEPVGVAKKNWGLRVMAFSAVCFVVSLGLCGGITVVRNNTLSGYMMAAGLMLAFGSLAGLFVGLLMVVIRGLTSK